MMSKLFVMLLFMFLNFLIFLNSLFLTWWWRPLSWPRRWWISASWSASFWLFYILGSFLRSLLLFLASLFYWFHFFLRFRIFSCLGFYFSTICDDNSLGWTITREGRKSLNSLTDVETLFHTTKNYMLAIQIVARGISNEELGPVSVLSSISHWE